MCLLTFLPSGVQPDPAALRNGAEVYDDGHGFAIVAGRRLIVQHGLNADATIEAFLTARGQHRSGPALFHSRMTTHGEDSLANCHPFRIGGDARTVLAHNGILPVTVRPAMGDPRSDTRIAAEDFLPRFGSLRARRRRLAFERWMTTANKAVVLTVDRRFQERAYLFNEDAGLWDGDIWYSNTAYLPEPPGRYLTRAGQTGPWEGWDPDWDDWDDPAQPTALARCWHCRANIRIDEDSCGSCGWCYACHTSPEDCLCYAPARLDTEPTTGGESAR